MQNENTNETESVDTAVEMPHFNPRVNEFLENLSKVLSNANEEAPEEEPITDAEKLALEEYYTAQLYTKNAVTALVDKSKENENAEGEDENQSIMFRAFYDWTYGQSEQILNLVADEYMKSPATALLQAVAFYLHIGFVAGVQYGKDERPFTDATVTLSDDDNQFIAEQSANVENADTLKRLGMRKCKCPACSGALASFGIPMKSPDGETMGVGIPISREALTEMLAKKLMGQMGAGSGENGPDAPTGMYL